jgi:KipI family sensor histidine kinase inhibitor
MTEVPVADVEVSACGASALRIVARSADRELDWATVHALAAWLTDQPGAAALSGLIPTYDSLLVEFDPVAATMREVRSLVARGLAELWEHRSRRSVGRHFDVPVVYGGEDGPDLGFVAGLEGWTEEALIAAHTGKTYVIRCYGSPAASPMMDAPDLPVPVPRLKSPRSTVPEGVVSLAGRQAVIAPASAPGGWQVIGRTPLVLLHKNAEPLVPYRPGDTLRFHRIGSDEFEARRGEPLEPNS